MYYNCRPSTIYRNETWASSAAATELQLVWQRSHFGSRQRLWSALSTDHVENTWTTTTCRALCCTQRSHAKSLIAHHSAYYTTDCTGECGTHTWRWPHDAAAGGKMQPWAKAVLGEKDGRLYYLLSLWPQNTLCKARTSRIGPHTSIRAHVAAQQRMGYSCRGTPTPECSVPGPLLSP